MSRLYEELRPIQVHDATVHNYLKMQNATGQDDMTIAIALIRQLVQEKKAHFDDAVNTRNRSVVPVLSSVFKELTEDNK